MREIVLTWATAAGGGRKSILYFSDAVDPDTQLAAVKAMCEFWKSDLHSSTVITYPATGRELDPATGGLTGEWSATAPTATTGTGLGSPVADASQALIQWRTPVVVGGRFLKGRTFIPGLASASINNGNVAPLVAGRLLEGANSLLASTAVFSIWHRPKGVVPGSVVPASAASVWQEFAVLRRRRS